jgi:amino acid adenylation domain-containing protein
MEESMNEATITHTEKDCMSTPLRYYDITSSLPDLFCKQVLLHPDNPAVIDQKGILSYKELDDRSTSICLSLLNAGIKRGSFIGIFIKRSASVISSLLGILKAGCAYVPLDPDYPSERLRHIIENAGISVILTEYAFKEHLTQYSAALIFIDDESIKQAFLQSFEPLSGSAPDAPAYIIYTSGSTGKPKGVCCHHKGVINLLDDFQCRQFIGPGDRCSWWASLNFDASVFEIFSPLLAGAALIIVPDSVRSDAWGLMDWLHENQVTSAFLPPMMISDFHDWVDQNPDKSRLRLLLTGVEPIAENLLRTIDAFLPQLTIVNGYGPTETTICATLYTVKPAGEKHKNTPIGKPVKNMHIHLLNEEGDEVDVASGENGEIFIGGIGVSRGYLNLPAENERLFISDPCFPGNGHRMYRTGDIAHYLEDGNLVFVGRKDNQVKYLGYRIELGEIETVLRHHSGVGESIVMVREDVPGVKHLVAYVVCKRGVLVQHEELHSILRSSLPGYMIPAAIVFLDKIPMTPNGKSDKQALPPPRREDFSVSNTQHSREPESAIEQELSALFSALLGIEKLSTDDNFFSLGANSLLATRLCSQIQMRWNLKIPLLFVFEHPTVKEIADEILRSEQTVDPESRILHSSNQHSSYPVSIAQKSMWIFQQLHSEGTLFNIPLLAQVTGELHPDILKKSFAYLIQRHESLRTVFTLEHEELVQKITPLVQFELTEDDFSALTQDEQSEAMLPIAKKNSTIRFELDKGPLLNAHLVKLSQNSFQLFITFHHLIIDGWGADLFFRELAHCYQAYCNGAEPSLPDKTLSYGDFCLWQNRRIKGEEIARQTHYWVEKLQGSSFIQHIPSDYTRPPVQTFSGSRQHLSFPSEITPLVNDFCIRHNCTTFMFFMTAFQTLLYRYSGLQKIITGTTIACRNHPDTESVIGLFINSLAIKTDFNNVSEFTHILGQVRKNALEAFENQDVPFQLIVEEVTEQHEKSLHPVFQNLFILQNTPPAFHAGNVNFSYEEVGNNTAKLDLLLNLESVNNIFTGWIEYNSDLFNADTIARLTGDYLWIVTHALRESGEPVCAWPLPSIPQSGFYNLQPQPLKENSIHHFFEAQVQRTPDHQAICYGTKNLTYKELDDKANNLARYLAAHGVGADVPVGIYLNRGLEMVVAILGILKAGGCYVPLDTGYPVERILYMIDDSSTRLVITDAFMAQRLSSFPEVDLVFLDSIDSFSGDQAPAYTSGAENSAYIMYTSGSTGKPKGVKVLHRGVVNLVTFAVKTYALKAGDRLLQFFSICFDGSVEEIFMALSSGATLVIRDFDAAIAVPDFFALIEKYQVSVLDLPTIFWHELVYGVMTSASSIPSSLRLIIIGGEQASVMDFRNWHKACNGRVKLINTYGPTECTVISAYCEPESIFCAYDEENGLPVGRPIDNTSLYIVDSELRPVPFGMPGELLIGGMGLSGGYLNLPLLTAEKFIPDNFQQGSSTGRLYRTGDMVRALSDGNLQFLGRVDNQVKIRGFRIEPGEIESLLMQHEKVKSCAVIALKNHSCKTVLVAYFTSEAKDVTTSELRYFLSGKLPDYMVPFYFVKLGSLPFLSNGKLDRKALPAPNCQVAGEITYVPPGDDLEKKLVAIWEKVLGVHPVGIRDNFFHLGGHSLLAVRLCSQIQEQINSTVTLSGFFQALTIEDLARRIRGNTWHPDLSCTICIQKGALQNAVSPLFFIHVLGIGLKYCKPLASSLGPELPIYAMSVQLLEKQPYVGSRVEDLARYYIREVKHIQPKGPYILAGFSFGGLVVFEMARQMSAGGDDVRLVALFDSLLPVAFKTIDALSRAKGHIELFKNEGFSYLAKKALHRVHYEWLINKQKVNHWYSRMMLRYYNRADRMSSMPVGLKEFAAWQANKEAAQLYNPGVYCGKVTLFRSYERAHEIVYLNDPELGWGGVAAGGLEIIDCPGDHTGMLSYPDVLTLAEKLKKTIKQALFSLCFVLAESLPL